MEGALLKAYHGVDRISELNFQAIFSSSGLDVEVSSVSTEQNPNNDLNKIEPDICISTMSTETSSLPSTESYVSARMEECIVAI